MSRPSRNVDEKLLRAGRELFPAVGCAGLSVRKVVDHAGVNLGMFHYHFRTKEAFLRRLLQGLYDEMFANLEVVATSGDAPVAALRQAMNVIAHFAGDQRLVLRRLLADALDGQPLAREFLQLNLPRHVTVLMTLIAACQNAGELKPVPVAQAVAFLAGAVGAPLLAASAVVDEGWVSAARATDLAREILSDQAIAQRIDLALAGLAVEPRGSRT